jgi:uncharacterized integral membrane protein
MRVRLVVIVVLLMLLLAFIAQNTGDVQVKFLGWTFPLSRIVLLALTGGVGILIGLLLGRPWRSRRPRQGFAKIDKPKKGD